MQTIPPDILARFDSILKQRNVPPGSRSEYRKWLRYFLDFRAKYPEAGERSVQVKQFSDKLRSKGQTDRQLEQAADAVSFFFASQRQQPHASEATGAQCSTLAVVRGVSVSPRDQGLAALTELSRKAAGMLCGPPGDALPIWPRATPVCSLKISWRRNTRTLRRN